MSTPAPAANPAETLFEADAWVEAMLYIPSIAAMQEDGPWPDVLKEDFIESVFDLENHAILKAFPRLAQLFSVEEYPEPWRVLEALRTERRGFFVQAGTMARRYGKDGRGYSTGGSWHLDWLHAPTEADIAPTVAAWAERMHEADKAEKAA